MEDIKKKGFDKMIDKNELKELYSLEDYYNILCRNKPQHKNKLYPKWKYLENITQKELLDENENIQECNELIDKIVDFLEEQKKEVLKKYE